MAQAHTVQDVLAEIKSLEPLPQVALRVMSLSQKEDIVPRELVEVIQTDAGITAKVLKLCNSAYYGFRREIASLPEAGNLLGCTTLVNLVLTSCANRYFRHYGAQSRASARRWWERSVTTALATSMFAGTRPSVDRSRAYTAGLLENVGQLVADRFLPELGATLEAEVAAGADRLEAEERVLGLHHAEIGAQLAERWNFPAILVDTIRHHHTPENATVDPLLVCFAHLGEMVMQRLEAGGGPDPLAYGLKSGALGLAGMSRESFDQIEVKLRAEIARAKELIDLS